VNLSLFASGLDVPWRHADTEAVKVSTARLQNTLVKSITPNGKSSTGLRS